MFPGSSRAPDPWGQNMSRRALPGGSSAAQNGMPRLPYPEASSSDPSPPHVEPRAPFPDQSPPVGYAFDPHPTSFSRHDSYLHHPGSGSYQAGSRLPIPDDREFVTPFASGGPTGSTAHPSDPAVAAASSSVIPSTWDSHMAISPSGFQSDPRERSRANAPPIAGSGVPANDGAPFMGGQEDATRSRPYPLSNTLSDPAPTIYGRPTYANTGSDPFPLNGTAPFSSQLPSVVNGPQDKAVPDGNSASKGVGTFSAGTDAPVTVADIVGRPIVERRRRPIPHDPSQLVQLDDPIRPRRKRASDAAHAGPSEAEASTSQARVDGQSTTADGAADGAEEHDAALALQRGSKRKYKPSEQVDNAEAKRIRNTLAARRHRLYKATQWRNMQEQLEHLRARNAELEAQASQRPDEAALVAENRTLVTRIRAMEAEHQDLLARIQQMEYQLRRSRHPGFY